ncbi:MAG TPA: type II toxin-antitoxin system HipA family toxin [Candidatus Acidoferrales bacterium]|nr:type II toxin-antitoxin system HipA family toxin [Candidatus Acidoferrales bacterium]
MSPPLRVSFAFSPGHEVPVGRLALDGNSVVFEYDSAFGNGLALNPTWRTAPGLVRPRDPRAFDGLHGVFGDSLPDAWGELLLERRLRHAERSTTELTVLDRLALVGREGRGALVYEPSQNEGSGLHELDLDRLAEETREILSGSADDVLYEIERLGGSSGGARPKVHVALDDSGHARADERATLPAGFTSWIVKFHGSVDRFDDIGPLEAAYAEAARVADIEMPRTRLIPAKHGPGYFATERFDRTAQGGRLHMLSVAGMLDVDWNLPSISYELLLDAVRGVTRDEQAVVQMFRRMAFNVLAGNRDDHTKQHAFLMDEHGVWRLSPAFDLTLAAGPGNEHYLTINGRGRDIERSDLLAVAQAQGINSRRAAEIIDGVATAVAKLPSIANEFGISRSTATELKTTIERQHSQ